MKTTVSAVALGAAALFAHSPANAQMAGMDHGQHAPDAAPLHTHESHDIGSMAMAMPGMSGAGSGTARLPEAEGMMQGLYLTPGDWRLMVHGYVWPTYSNQGGPRGETQGFATSMAMADASRDLSSSTRLRLRGMFSLDPLMGKRGYPNLFATGETANGVALIDRQHPHDFFMELSARIDTDVADGVTAFLYGGPSAEPALGPSAFMHRRSAVMNPEAPITHHWIDSTHVSFGVVTAGVTMRTLQIEASGFRGREPDENRWDIETPALDSWSVRATWTPAARWAASLSFGRLKAPESLHPGEDETRLIGTLAYTGSRLALTAAFGHKTRIGGRALDAYLVEGNWAVSARHTLFGRVESLANDELFPEGDPLHDRPFQVTKATLGYAYTLPVGPLGVSLGGSGSVYAKPAALDAAYGRMPMSFTLFAKLALGR